MISIPYLVFITIAMAVAWWLSGYDSQVTGEDKTGDFLRRAIRCGVTLALLTMVTFGGFLAPAICGIIAIIWMGCGAEFFMRQIHKLIDPEDRREFDPKQIHRDLDRLARLTQEGRNEEALALCRQLETSGEASPLAIETTLFQLYQQTLEHASPRLMEIQYLREQGQFEEAASRLRQMLANEPGNWAARLVLMRLYAENLSEPEKAFALLQVVDKRAQLHPAFVKFARRSIDRWRGVIVEDEKPEEGIESLLVARKNAQPAQPASNSRELSVDELLKRSQFATAIEHLEGMIAVEPGNFDVQLKLAEVYAVHCADLNHAAKIVRGMENSAIFTAEQIRQAKVKLTAWQRGRRS